MSDIYGVSRRRIIGEVWLWLILATVTIAAISIGLWAFGVFTSNVAGAGGAIRQKNATVNRVQKQEMFEQLAADYDGYLIKIAAAVTAVKTTTDETDKALRQTELVGLKQVCVDAAQQFNAESHKYTSRDWKSAGLPGSLDAQACAGAS